jgi:hypothetical protein
MTSCVDNAPMKREQVLYLGRVSGWTMSWLYLLFGDRAPQRARAAR